MYTWRMPPSPNNPGTDVSHMLPEHTQTHEKAKAGPVVGIVIVVVLMIFGGLYFWGAQLNKVEEPLPLIPGDSATL